MPHLSATQLLSLAALLVAVTLGVVLFAKLPAILMSSLLHSRAGATPASPVPTPASQGSPAPSSTAHPGVIATPRFTLSAPDTFRVTFAGGTGDSIQWLS